MRRTVARSIGSQARRELIQKGEWFDLMQHRPGVETGQIDMPRREVLAKVPGSDAKTERIELKEKFLFHKMNLPQIRAAGVFRFVI